MSNIMKFNEDYNDFLDGYSFTDRKEIYTNGCMLIPTFRAKQGMEYYADKAYQQGRADAIEDACKEVNRFIGYLDEDMIYRITLKLRQNCRADKGA